MKQHTTDTYTIAWFKIAECVSRGEKERALGVYRLLAHSLNDSALATQLEADILLVFNIEEAIEKYEQAAILYIQGNRTLKASYIYEHLMTLNPGNKDYHSIVEQLRTHTHAQTGTDSTEYIKAEHL